MEVREPFVSDSISSGEAGVTVCRGEQATGELRLLVEIERETLSFLDIVEARQMLRHQGSEVSGPNPSNLNHQIFS